MFVFNVTYHRVNPMLKTLYLSPGITDFLLGRTQDCLYQKTHPRVSSAAGTRKRETKQEQNRHATRVCCI